jgi:hypothetical protein
MNQQDIIQSVQQGNFLHNWVEVNGQLFSQDALKVNDVRVGVSAATQVEIGRLIGGTLLIAVEFEQLFMASIKVPPFPSDILTTTSETFSQRTDYYVNLILTANSYLVEPIVVSGKTWINDPLCSPTKACNYGFFTAAYPNYKGIKTYKTSQEGLYAIQPKANQHNHFHSDYSQLAYFRKI